MSPEKRHLNRIAEAGCVLCRHLGYGHTPAEIHHPRFCVGMGQRASDWLAVGLCAEHHRGDSGIHGLGEREFERRYRLSEPDLLAMCVRALNP